MNEPNRSRYIANVRWKRRYPDGRVRIPRGGPDGTTPIRQDDSSATPLRRSLSLRLARPHRTFARPHQADPRGFLETHRPPVVLDEVQNAPELLPLHQARGSSRDRSVAGQYLLDRFTEPAAGGDRLRSSLAWTHGDAAKLFLLIAAGRSPGDPEQPPAMGNGIADAFSEAIWTRLSLRCGTTSSGFVVSGTRRRPGPRRLPLWHAGYLQTYLERDAAVAAPDRKSHRVRRTSSGSLRRRSAQLLSLTDVSRDLGVAVNTVKAWLSVLEATLPGHRAAALLRERRGSNGSSKRHQGVLHRHRDALPPGRD